MQSDFIIVGQGIAGSLLYHQLTRAGASCMVIDDNKQNSASRVAAGLINPVTGRRLVKSWMIDELIPAFKRIYGEIESDHNINCLYETKLSWHMPATDILMAFEKRLAEQTNFLAEANTGEMRKYFLFPYKAGNVEPCFIVDVQLVMEKIRGRIQQSGKLLDEKFDHQLLTVSHGEVQYKDHKATKIIFCEGSAGYSNSWFSSLPYSLNKGEALIVSINDLPRNCIYKFWQTLVPLPREENLWWYGSNYIWDFQDEHPTKEFRLKAETELKSWLKIPFTIVDHRAAIRYATVERRPFIGFHPLHPGIGIFNGWGTKGCSLVPYFAEQFAEHLMKPQIPIHLEVDVKRFSKILKVRPF